MGDSRRRSLSANAQSIYGISPQARPYSQTRTVKVRRHVSMTPHVDRRSRCRVDQNAAAGASFDAAGTWPI